MLTWSNLVSLPLVVLFLSGCNGSVHSRLWNPAALSQQMMTKDGVPGVIGYMPKSVLETDEFTQVLDKDGKFVTADCNPVKIQKVTTVADQTNPIQIWYESGILEASQFGVQWSGGVFTAVSSQSSPDQGKTISNISSAASNFAKIAAGGVTPVPVSPSPSPGKPNCNGTSTFVKFSPLILP